MRRMLLALDDRGQADAAAAMVRTWVAQDRSLHVVLLYVTEMLRGRFPGPRLPMSYEREVAQAIEERMTTDVFRSWPSRIQFLHRSGFSVSRVICQTAEAFGCDMIVLGGDPPRGFWRCLGSHIPQEVLSHAKVSVVVIRPTPPRRIEIMARRGPPRRIG